jgi:Ca2+-binding EF-hand superfamily protein
MRKVTLSLIAGAATLAFGGSAFAQEPAGPQPDMTRAAAEQRADQAFDRLDVNHDGKLDQADREARDKIRFERVDTNHDGQVSYAEFTAAHGRFDEARKGRFANRGDQRVERGDGSEHQAARNGAGLGIAGRIADSDKDGTVTRTEFQAAALQRFDRLDANHDGTVSRDEAKAARDNMRRQWQSHREARVS